MSKRSMQAASKTQQILPEAKTDGQRALSEAIDHNRIVFVTGPAGSGKTFVSMSRAVSMLRQEKISKIVLTRPVVEAGESLGFLPGTLEDKIDPYMRPLYDAIRDIAGSYQLNAWLSNGVIEIAPLAYMRGRTINNGCILFDEAQNATMSQLKLLLTRIGTNTKIIVNGDIRQIDIDESKSGLLKTANMLSVIDGIKHVRLGIDDIVRDDIVSDMIEVYEKNEQKKAENDKEVSNA